MTLTCDPRARRVGGGLGPLKQQFGPFRKGAINKHVSIINIVTYTSNLKEMKFSTFVEEQNEINMLL